MNQKKLLQAGLLAVVLVAVAAFATMGGGGETSANSSERLYDNLLDKVNDVAVLEIADKDGSIKLEKLADGWGLAAKGGYPVEFERVKQNLVAIAEMETIERKTKNPELYSKLGVAGVGEPESESKLVTLQDGSGTELAALIVGTAKVGRAGSGQVYVRKKGDEQSWLVSGTLDLGTDPQSWLAKQIMKVTRDRIQAVEIQHPDGEALRISKPSKIETSFTVHDLPEERELSYATVADSLANTLEWLNLDDVKAAGEVDLAAAENRVESHYWTFDGLRIDATTGDIDGETWATFRASQDEAGASFVAKPEEASETEGAAEEASPEDIAKEAKELNANLSKWVYKLPSHTKGNLQKRMDGLLKPLPVETPEDATDPADVNLEDLLTPEQMKELGIDQPADSTPAEDGGDDGN